MRKHFLFRLVIRIESQLHQHQQMDISQEAKEESPCATGITDKLNECILRSQRPVEIKGYYLLHSVGLGIRSMICFTAHERAMVTMT